MFRVSVEWVSWSGLSVEASAWDGVVQARRGPSGAGADDRGSGSRWELTAQRSRGDRAAVPHELG